MGGCFGIAIDSTSTLFAWGANSNGELGTGDYDTRIKPVPILSLQDKRVKLVSCGSNSCLALGSDITQNRSLNRSRESTPLRNRSVNKERNLTETKDKSGKQPSYLKRRLSAENSAKKNMKRNDSFISAEKFKTDYKSPSKFESKIGPISVNKSFSHFRNHHEIENEIEFKNNQIEELNLKLDQIMSEYRASRAEVGNLNEAVNDLALKNQQLQAENDERRRYNDDNSHQQSRLLEITNMNQDLIRDVSTLKKKLEESNNEKYLASNDLKIVRDENFRIKKTLDEHIHYSKIENQTQVDILSRDKETLNYQIQDLNSKLDEERIRRKQIERDLEAANSHRYRVEELFGVSQNKVEEIQKYSENIKEDLRKSMLQADMLDSNTKHLSKQVTDFERQIENKNIEIERFKRDLSGAEIKLATSKSNLEKVNRDLENQNLENQRLNKDLESKIIENQKLNRNLDETITRLNYEISEHQKFQAEQSNLQENLEKAIREKENICNMLESDADSLKKDLSDILSENRYFKQSFDDLNYELEKLHQQIDEKNVVIDHVSKIAED